MYLFIYLFIYVFIYLFILPDECSCFQKIKTWSALYLFLFKGKILKSLSDRFSCPNSILSQVLDPCCWVMDVKQQSLSPKSVILVTYKIRKADFVLNKEEEKREGKEGN